MTHTMNDVGWPKHRMTWVLLAACVLIATAAWIVGIEDNPPGITLLAVAACAAVVAFAHRIRTRKRMLLLALASLVGFVVFAVLHNLFEALAAMTRNVALLSPALAILGVGFFILAVAVCPPALLVGLTGAGLSQLLAGETDAMRAAALFGVSGGLIVTVGLFALPILSR